MEGSNGQREARRVWLIFCSNSIYWTGRGLGHSFIIINWNSVIYSKNLKFDPPWELHTWYFFSTDNQKKKKIYWAFNSFHTAYELFDWCIRILLWLSGLWVVHTERKNNGHLKNLTIVLHLIINNSPLPTRNLQTKQN